MQAAPWSRRQIVKFALGGDVGAGCRVPYASQRGAATELTLSVAAMVADAEVSWEREVSGKMEQACIRTRPMEP